MHAFEITEEDVEAVLKLHWKRVVNADGQSFESMAANLLPRIDHAKVEHSALYGDELDEQTAYAHGEIERQLSHELAVLEPLPETVLYSQAWFDKQLDSVNFAGAMSAIADPVRTAAELICREHEIKGICDPAYICNVIAFELGWGDGQGMFFSEIKSGRQSPLDILPRLANRLAFSYGACKDVTPKAILDKLQKTILPEQQNAPTMKIEQREQGWTVVNQEGRVMLRTPEGEPGHLTTREEVVAQCQHAGLYQAAAGNPCHLPEGTLIEVVGTSSGISHTSEVVQSERATFNRPRG